MRLSKSFILTKLPYYQLLYSNYRRFWKIYNGWKIYSRFKNHSANTIDFPAIIYFRLL